MSILHLSISITFVETTTGVRGFGTLINMDPTYARRRIFIHVCPHYNKHALKRAYWLNAISGFEDLAETHERLAGDIIRQVTNTTPEKLLANVAARYEKLAGIQFTDASHFIIDFYVTSSHIKALYFRRDLNFVPKNTLEPVIEHPDFRDIPMAQLKEPGESIHKAIVLSRTMLRNSRLSSIWKTVCYTYVPTHLLYLLVSYLSQNHLLALYAAATIPTVILMASFHYMLLHFRDMRKTDFTSSTIIIPVNPTIVNSK